LKTLNLIRAKNYMFGHEFDKRQDILCNSVKFIVHKFTKRSKPKDINKIIIINSFGEMGCETLVSLYCIPSLIRMNPSCYFIVLGFHGRSYLYKHLVDEFWELDDSYNWLRGYSYAFVNLSNVYRKILEKIKTLGNIISGDALGHIMVGSTCRNCEYYFGSQDQNIACPKCSSRDIDKSLLSDIVNTKKRAVKIPKPRVEYISWAKKLVGENVVGIFARKRKLYNRNLSIDFYEDLIRLLQEQKYTIVWLGEKESIHECPKDMGVIDFSSMAESYDLEKTLAVIGCCNFTIQYWTASTRLAGITDTPFVLFESPGQIIPNQAQEAHRICLTSNYDKRKIVLCNFDLASKNQDIVLRHTKKAIDNLLNNNYSIEISLVDHPQTIYNECISKLTFWV